MEVRIEEKVLPFAMAEEIKNLRTSIIFSGEDIKTIVFTSCTANEGKSTLSIETVKSFAELGKKTLLIDCDLRKSILKNKIKSGNMKKGLTHFLTGQCDLKDIVYECKSGSSEAEFYVIPAGPTSNSPTELISSEKFTKMLQKLRDEYDVIFIDTPPLGDVVDASIVSAIADGTIMVVEAGRINYPMIQKVRDKLLSSNARILGVVLNKADKSNKSYGYYKRGYGYGYGYGYGQSEN